MLHELLWCLYCVAFSKAMGSERQKAVIGLSHTLTERQIYSLLLFTRGFSKLWLCCEIRLAASKASREVGIYQHRMN